MVSRLILNIQVPLLGIMTLNGPIRSVNTREVVETMIFEVGDVDTVATSRIHA